MRKILFFVFAAGLTFAGCKKDSGGSASIVGTWQLNKAVTVEYQNNVQIDSDTTTTGNVTFNSDGTYSSTDNSSTDNGTYTYNSSTKVLTTVSKDDSTTLNLQVTNLTASDLHFNYNESDGTYKITIDADYKR